MKYILRFLFNPRTLVSTQGYSFFLFNVKYFSVQFNLVEIFMRSTLMFLQSNQKNNFEKLLDVITKWEKENILKGFKIDVSEFVNF